MENEAQTTNDMKSDGSPCRIARKIGAKKTTITSRVIVKLNCFHNKIEKKQNFKISYCERTE